MALTWNWNDKIGTLSYTQEWEDGKRDFEISIYKGNALLIFIHEYKQNESEVYNMFSFFCDMDHLKNLCKEPGFFRGWKKIKISTTDAKIWKACNLLYKQGIEIEFDHAPF